MTSTQSTSKKISGPRGYPLIGSLLEARKDMLGLLTRAAKEHGNIAYVRMGPLKVYFLTHPEYIRQVLQDTRGIYIKSPIYQKLKYILGNGLVTSDGAHWKRQRKLAQPAFHHQYLTGLAGMMAQSTQVIAQKWMEAAKTGVAFDVTHDMMELTLDIIMQAMFGMQLKEDLVELRGAMHTILTEVLHRSLSPLPLPLFIPTPRNRRLKKAKEFFDKIIYRVIAQHQQKKSNDANLLDMLINAKDETTGEFMSTEQLRDEVMTIFMAGHETTATALSWTWYLLDQNPDVAEKLREEFKTVLNGRLPTFQDVPKLVYTKMVLQESMRLYPPIWAVSRTATQEDQIGGHRIPKGSMVMMGIHAMHRHPDYWENPEVFNPERFRNEDINRERKHIYFPFGGGSRVCIGNNFAMMEGAIILAVLVQQFQLKLVPGQNIVPRAVLVLKAKDGIKMTVQKA